mgnify:CR=1 FL=1
MKRPFPTGLAMLGLVFAAGTAIAQGMGPGRGMGMGPGMGHGMGRNDMVRHRFFMMNGLPAAYQNLENPLPATPETIAAGRELYDDNCALCHGDGGRGDGEGAKDLDPRPGDLAALRRMPIATDGYFFWTVSEGGETLGTDMPAFKDVLSTEERWQIIAALRAGLPPNPR